MLNHKPTDLRMRFGRPAGRAMVSTKIHGTEALQANLVQHVYPSLTMPDSKQPSNRVQEERRYYIQDQYSTSVSISSTRV